MEELDTVQKYAKKQHILMKYYIFLCRNLIFLCLKDGFAILMKEE
jgi:hypothetical protein